MALIGLFRSTTGYIYFDQCPDVLYFEECKDRDTTLCFGGGGAVLLNQCNNSHVLQNKGILLMQSRFLGRQSPPPPGISVLGRVTDEKL